MAGSRRFPIPSFRFDVRIEVDGSRAFQVGFQEVSGLGAKVDFRQEGDSSQSAMSLKIPEKVTPSDVKFKKGVFRGESTAHDLLNAFGLYDDSFRTDPKYAKIFITLKDEADSQVMAWIMQQAYPSSWDFGALNAMSSEVMLETITFTCREMKSEMR